MKNALSAFLISLFLCAGNIAPADAGPLVFSGSTTFQKRILEPAQAALQKKTGVTIEIRGVGTIKGIKDLAKGEAAAAIASAPLDVALREAGLAAEEAYREHVIMTDVVVPIVHPMNPVKALTGEQLSGIFTGKITNWKQVGGPDSRIAVVAAPRGSGTRAFIQAVVMKNEDYAENAFVAVTTREQIELLARSQIAIGALSEGFVRMSPGRVKVVKTRPLSRHLSIVTKGEPTDEVLAVIKFLKSAQAKKLFR